MGMKAALRRLPPDRGQSQFIPQTVPITETQVESQRLLQQNPSAEQIAVTQLGVSGGLSHSALSAPPVSHRPCAQVPQLPAQMRLRQTVRTSLTHVLSQAS